MRSELNIAILETGTPATSLRQQYGGYADMFLRSFAPYTSLSCTVLETYLTNDTPGLDQYDGYLITGSPFGVYEDHEFIPGLENFIRAGIEKSVPMVGICFGHQIMARAAGAQVEKSPKGWGVGVHEYALAPGAENILPALAADRTVRCIVSHQDQVLTIPEHIRCLGGSDFCPHGILQYAEGPAVSFQMHPEFTDDFAKALLESRRDKIDPDRVVQAQSSFDSVSGKNDILTAIEYVFTNGKVLS